MYSLMQDIMQHKLVFIETQDVVETTLALDNYRRACDCGRGAVFFSVARYYSLLFIILSQGGDPNYVRVLWVVLLFPIEKTLYLIFVRGNQNIHRLSQKATAKMR
jgi:hypothetical protein